MKRLIVGTVLTLGLLSTSVLAQEYEVPPSYTTSVSVPWISDQDMEACVKLYNEGKWLSQKINSTQVNQYSQSSVNTYNDKVNQHSQMTTKFNKNCAGKQSESAYKAAQKLNTKLVYN